VLDGRAVARRSTTRGAGVGDQLGERGSFDETRLNAYTQPDACDEGIRAAIHHNLLGDSAVSRTLLDREAVSFYVGVAVSRGTLLRGGRIVDPATALDGIADLRIRDGVIAEVGSLIPEAEERVVDVDGLIVAPGLIDVHVHLREPGQEWKETIASGTAAAAAGGFTTLFCMPNTDPALDSVAALEELKRRTDRDALVRVRPIAAVSEGRRGGQPVDFEALVDAGAVGFSDDGESTPHSGIMREALDASRALGIPVMVHCEDPGLIGGAMHDAETSRGLGLQAIPAAAEEIIIARDLALATLTGGWLHVCHVSTGVGAELIGAAKRQGAWVTAEVMPHHLTMTDEWVAGRRTFVNVNEPGGPDAAVAEPDTKVNPPLRTRGDARRLLESLKRGIVDIVATDHAPHARPEKLGRSFSSAAFGLSGSEFALPSMMSLVRACEITISDMVNYLSVIPARLWSLPTGTLTPGAPADIVVFDPNERWRVEPERLASLSANTPLMEMELRGRVKMTFVGGDERHRDW
jgi:dihydroorotase